MARRSIATNANDSPLAPATPSTARSRLLQKLERYWTVLASAGRAAQNDALWDQSTFFNQYNGIGSRFQWWEPPRDLLDAMPRKRRSLFRQAYGEAANTGLETRNLFNRALG